MMVLVFGGGKDSGGDGGGAKASTRSGWLSHQWKEDLVIHSLIWYICIYIEERNLDCSLKKFRDSNPYSNALEQIFSCF